MKTIRNYAFIVMMLFAPIAMFNSCIKGEALNSEADIEVATIENGSKLLQVEPLINNNKVTFKLRQFASSYEFAPEFVITEGATIEPASGTIRNFQTAQTYTVKSQDGAWTKQYTVEFVVDEGTLFAYSFENVEIVETEGPEGIYHKFFDFLPDMINVRED